MQPPLAPEGAPGRDTAVRRGHLCVVDDMAENRELLRQCLEQMGHTCALVDNGNRALEELRAHHFDLVLLDLMMPGMSGFEVLERMKGDAALRHLPVVMISAVEETDVVVRCIELGADDYLPKPFNPVLLRARIGACLERKRWHDRAQRYLAQIEDEKARADELLHVIFPAPVVAELKATSAVKPRRHDGVAVLFCDIAGFTAWCDHHQPEEVMAQLQRWVDTCEQIALDHHLEKIKTIGDAFMATAGLLRPEPEAVLSCIRGGLEMVAAARRLDCGWDARVGVHVGPVIAGVVGHRQYLFDVWGDTVNTAARIQGLGRPQEVSVSEAAWRAVAGKCRGESRGRMAVRGKGEMEIFVVTP